MILDECRVHSTFCRRNCKIQQHDIGMHDRPQAEVGLSHLDYFRLPNNSHCISGQHTIDPTVLSFTMKVNYLNRVMYGKH